MKSFEHFIVDISYHRTCYRKQINKEMIMEAEEKVKEVLKGGCPEILDDFLELRTDKGVYMDICMAKDRSSYCIHIYLDKEMTTPLVTTLGFKKKEDAKKYFALMGNDFTDLCKEYGNPLDYGFPLVCDFFYNSKLRKSFHLIWAMSYTEALAWAIWKK